MIKISRKYIAVLLILAIEVSAVEVTIKEAPLNTSKEKIDAFKEYLKANGNFTANSENDLLKNLEDDVTLANHYIAEGMSKNEEQKINNMINRYLAKAEVKRIQEKIKLDDKIIDSYYLDNIETFKMKPIADITILQFKTLESASDFFSKTKKKESKELMIDAKEEAAKLTQYKHPINKMYPVYRDSLRDYNESDYFTPPQYIKGQFVLLYVKSIEDKNRYYPLEKVRKYITDTLYKETFVRERRKIIDDYRGEK